MELKITTIKAGRKRTRIADSEKMREKPPVLAIGEWKTEVVRTEKIQYGITTPHYAITRWERIK